LPRGGRNTEIRTLRWGDFDVSPLHQLSERGGSVCTAGRVRQRRRDQCPLALWNAILDYLSASARLKTIKPQDYIFTPLTTVPYVCPTSISAPGLSTAALHA